MPIGNSFLQIPINHTDISQSELNIDEKVRSNLFPWNGQFSPQFIEALLSNYASSDFFVIDPFAGSGTVLCECARKRISAYGIELNASAYHMAKNYELANLSDVERSEIINKVDILIYSIDCSTFIIPTLKHEIDFSKILAYKNILSTLVILMDIPNRDVALNHLQKKWESLKKALYEIPTSDKCIHVDKGDARHLHLYDSSADLLITSPPYINVFNYHQKYRKSVELLGYDVLSTAKTEFGSNRKNRGNRFLTVIQYCIDMALSMNEARRTCKDASRMIYIVGRESSVLGYSFCNSELVYKIGTEIFFFDFVLRQERMFKNRFGQIIYEDILHFFNNKSQNLTSSEIISKARNIAIDIIQEKINLSNDNPNKPLLVEALKKASKVKPSEEVV